MYPKQQASDIKQLSNIMKFKTLDFIPNFTWILFRSNIISIMAYCKPLSSQQKLFCIPDYNCFV